MTLYVYQCPRCPSKVSLGGHMGFHVPAACLLHEEPVAMQRMPDTAKAFLAMDGAYSIGPMKVETLHKAGILMPETQHALEWMYRHRATNGMAGAFCNVGGRRCIDLVAFAKLIREKRA